MFASQAPAYEDFAKRSGDAVNAVVLPQAGHFVFVDPASAVWPRVLESTRTLLGLSH
jgi:hypothetical protein